MFENKDDHIFLIYFYISENYNMAQRYIPGLTSRPVDEPAGANVPAPKSVPTELIDSFINGSKQVKCIIVL